MKVFSQVKSVSCKAARGTKNVTGVVVHKTGNVAKTVTTPVRNVAVKRYAIHRSHVEINDRLALTGLALLTQDKNLRTSVKDVRDQEKAARKAAENEAKAAKKAAETELVTA